MFDQSAGSYDAISQWMSFGTGRRHRGQVLRHAGLSAGCSMLDVACGTGQVALAGQGLVGATGCVIGLDVSLGMLAQARQNGCRQVLGGIAESLPFADCSFDVLSMGYALRHAANLDTVFAEYHRVLKPGGQVILMEIAQPESRFVRAFTRWYMKTLVPGVVAIGTGDRNAATLMRYYWDSIQHCVPAATITSALDGAGFVDVHVRSWCGGLVKDYFGTRRA